MAESHDNRFDDFFVEDSYVALKNHLYNYRLRKNAVEKSLENENYSLIGEIGSGMSPVMTKTEKIIYSDLSLNALKTLRRINKKGSYVVANAMELPFKKGAFSHTLSSEVLEHLEDDKKAISELSRITKSGGKLIVTVPHQMFYFAKDDRFVEHYRRYDLDELTQSLKAVRLNPVEVKKVAGFLDKIAMWLAVTIFEFKKKRGSGTANQTKSTNLFFVSCFKFLNDLYMGLAWLEARIIPRKFATILLIKAQKS